MLRLLPVLFLGVIAFAQTPTVTGALNSADYGPRLCPGVLASIFGTNFGSTASAVSVTLGGKAAYVAGVTPSQMTVQFPVDAPTGAGSLVVTVNKVASAAFSVTLLDYAPALYTSGGTGSGPGLIRTLAGTAVSGSAPANPGDTLSVYAAGLGATNPATPTGTAPASSPTAITPTLTVGGASAVVSYAGDTPGDPGLYQINFKVPAGVQGTVPMVLSIGDQTSVNTVVIDLFGISSVVNNASFRNPGTVAPGSLASVFANGLGTTNQSVGFPSTNFQGVTVTFNGIPAPLFHLTATGNQIDLFVPSELPVTGTVNVQLTTPAGTGPNYSLTMAAASPGMYFLADPSTKNRFNAIALFNNTAWLDLPASMATALKIPGNCTASKYNPASICAQPATAGDFLSLFVTGLGKATPNGDPNGTPLSTGVVAPSSGVLYKTVATPTVALGTGGAFSVPVLFSGLAPGFSGLYQVDFQIPAGITGDDIPLVVSMGGATTDTRTISIH